MKARLRFVQPYGMQGMGGNPECSYLFISGLLNCHPILYIFMLPKGGQHIVAALSAFGTYGFKFCMKTVGKLIKGILG